MTKREIAARWILRQLVRLARTPLKTTAEFINAHQIVGISSADDQGLSWAARSRLHDAFQLAAMLRGDYGLLPAKAARSERTRPAASKKALPQENQKAARKVVVEMSKLARTPVNTIAEFIVAQEVSGVSLGELVGMTQAANDRLHAAFKKATHLRRAAIKGEAVSPRPRLALVG